MDQPNHAWIPLKTTLEIVAFGDNNLRGMMQRIPLFRVKSAQPVRVLGSRFLCKWANPNYLRFPLALDLGCTRIACNFSTAQDRVQ